MNSSIFIKRHLHYLISKGTIEVTKEITEEGIKMEASPLKYVEMLEAVENGMSMFSGGITSLFSLEFNQKLVQVINAHGAFL